MYKDRTYIDFWDGKRHARLGCGLSPEGPLLSLSNSEGKARTYLRVSDTEIDDKTVISILDDDGVHRVSLSFWADGGGLKLANETGKPQAGMILAGNEPGISLRG